MDAKRVIEYALSQIGTAENPLGSNKQPYGAMLDELPWYLYKDGDKTWIHKVNGYDWCAQFVDASFITTYTIDTARKMLFRPQYNNYGAVVKYAFNYFKNAGKGFKKEEYDPKPGDVIYFQNSAGLSHTGIVVAVTSTQVTTVEGNSGKNCWYVAKSTYSKTSSYIYGYGHPDYDEDPDPKEMDGFKVGNTYEVICNEDLMIRKGPGRSYDKAGELKKGDRIVCTGLRHDSDMNTWIQFDRGWCCGLYHGTRYLADPTPSKDGWVKKDGKWYYYKNGKMVTSDWILYKGDSYYFEADGAMVTGWKNISGKSYYFYPEGQMARSEWVDGKFLDMTGAQTYKNKGAWKKNNKGQWWQDASGWYPKNRSVMINRKEYKFDKDGYLET